MNYISYISLALISMGTFALGSAVTLLFVITHGNPRADQLQKELDREKRYIDELYFTLRRELCATLDADRKRMNDLGKTSEYPMRPPGKT